MIGRVAARARNKLGIAFFVWSCFLWGGSDRAWGARLALLVGNDEGQGADVQLRYAQSDTVQLAQLLGKLGGFDSGLITIQVGRTANELRQTLVELSTRLRTLPGEHLVVFYYSGHADGQNLHLGASSFPLAELRESVQALPAAVRLLILDACQSGVLTREKGGRPGQGFPLALGPDEQTRGLAILAASAGAELAQESDQLAGGVFSHYLRLGLAGLADRNRDGNVSLSEAFAFTSERTLAATLGTTTGPQHPTFRVDLNGSNELVLTRPGVAGIGYGHIRMDVPGWYFIRRPDGTVAAETVSRGNDLLALSPGPYEVTRRGRGGLDVASVRVAEGQATSISAVATYPIAFGQMVRKGGAPSTVAFAMSAGTMARTSVAALGPAWGATVAGRVDFSAASVELRLGLGQSQSDAAHLISNTTEMTASASVLRVGDLRMWARGPAFSLGGGIEAGVSYMRQRIDDGAQHHASSPFVGPTVVAETAIARRFYVRANMSAPVYALRVNEDAGASTLWRPALSGALGVGACF